MDSSRPQTCEIDPDIADVLAARNGDAVAWDNLVARHLPRLRSLLWRFAGTSADLDDLVQETFIRLVRNLPEWRPDRPFAHWVRRIAVNVGRDFCRRRAVRMRWHVAESSNDSGHATLRDEVADPAINPAARAAGREIKALLARLPPDDCTLLTLHYIEAWTMAEVAADLGWTLAATKLRAWRARGRLRALLMPKDFL